MTEVFSRLVSPSGTPVRQAMVRARLRASSSWLADASGRVVTETSVLTDEDGVWIMSLTPTGDYEVSDAYYEISELTGDNVVHTCTVPDSGSFSLRSVLVVPPQSSGFVPVNFLDDLQDVVVEDAVSGNVLRFDGSLWVSSVGSGGVTDHGVLTGLVDDDHSQYLTQARADTRYYTESEVDAALAGKSAFIHDHDSRYYTESEVSASLAGKSDTDHTHTSDIDAAVSAHTAASDPHSGYLTQGEGDARYSF